MTLQLSLQGHRNYIGSRDLLLAALEQPNLAGPLTAAGIDRAHLRTAIAAGRATDREDTEHSEPAADVASMPPDNSETIISLLHQVLQRRDIIAERLGRDT